MNLMSRRGRAGYTLTEVMLTVAILGIISTVGSSLVIQAQRYIRLTMARTAIQRDSRAALTTINRELRQGLASTVVIDQLTGQPPQSRVTFDRYKPDGTTQTVCYYQQGRKLFLKLGSATSGKAIADGLRYLAFTYPKTDDDAIISVSVTFEGATVQGQTKALQMAVEKVRIMNP